MKQKSKTPCKRVVDDMNKDLLTDQDLSDPCKAFLASPIGKHLLRRTADELRHSREELERVRPHEEKKIRDLQNNIWRARSVITWLDESLNQLAEKSDGFLS